MKYDILIAEESLTERMTLREIVRATGGSLREVSDTAELEEQCRVGRPRLCIISMGFPEWRRDVVHKLKQISPETRVILSTDQQTSVLRIMDGIGAGADRNYLTKPYRRGEVKEIIAKALS